MNEHEQRISGHKQPTNKQTEPTETEIESSQADFVFHGRFLFSRRGGKSVGKEVKQRMFDFELWLLTAIVLVQIRMPQTDGSEETQ